MTAAAGPLAEGDRTTVRVGAVAHGGHCVARVDGQVVFVRHALPDEVVTVEITEVHRGFLRGDAVAVLEPAPERVTPPCRYAGPDRCGGCDLQHVGVAGQLAWKESVVREQLLRLGGLSAAEVDALGVQVRALPGGPLGWRTRVRYAVDAADRAGLLKHRSHEVVPVDRCLIAHPAIQQLPVLPPAGGRWPGVDAVEVVASATGDVVVTALPGPTDDARVTDAADAQLTQVAAGRRFEVPTTAFWQVHPAAADTLVDAVLELLDPAPGESAWDLYSGAGLFAAAIAGRTGPTGRITLVESAGPGWPPPGVTWPTWHRWRWSRPGWSTRSPGGGSPARSTWWCSIRRGPARAPGWSPRSPPRPAGPSPTSPAIRPRSPVTCEPSGNSAGRWRNCAATTVSR